MNNLNLLPKELVYQCIPTESLYEIKSTNKKLHSIVNDLFKTRNQEMTNLYSPLKVVAQTKKDSVGNLLSETNPQKLFMILINNLVDKAVENGQESVISENKMEWALKNYKILAEAISDIHVADLTAMTAKQILDKIDNLLLIQSDKEDDINFFSDKEDYISFFKDTLKEFKSNSTFAQTIVYSKRIIYKLTKLSKEEASEVLVNIVHMSGFNVSGVCPYVFHMFHNKLYFQKLNTKSLPNKVAWEIRNFDKLTLRNVKIKP